jgi:hypothetical protein
MCQSTGCCGSCIRVLVAILNVLGFVSGVALVSVGAILKSSSSDLQKLIEQFVEPEIFDKYSKYLDLITTPLLIVGCVILALTLLGMIASCSGNKVILITYEVLLVIVFLTNICFDIYLLVNLSAYFETYAYLSVGLALVLQFLMIIGVGYVIYLVHVYNKQRRVDEFELRNMRKNRISPAYYGHSENSFERTRGNNLTTVKVTEGRY